MFFDEMGDISRVVELLFAVAIGRRIDTEFDAIFECFVNQDFALDILRGCVSDNDLLITR